MNNAERNKKIIALWNDGKTTSQIGAELGITPGAVGSVVSRARAKGLITRAEGYELPPGYAERNAKIVKLWNLGHSTGEVAKAVGVTNGVVLATVVKHRALGDIIRPMSPRR